MALNRQQNNLLRHQLKDIDDSSSTLYRQYYYSLEKSDAQKQLLRDEIEHNIRVDYANLVYLEKEIQNTEHHIQLKNKEIGILKVKKSLDTINSLEYHAGILELNDLNKKRNTIS